MTQVTLPLASPSATPGGFTLRPYQRGALTAIQGHLAQGKRRLVVAQATGTGKTVVFSHLPKVLELPGRWLILAHRQELLEQARDKIQAVNPSLTVGIEQAERKAGDAQIVIASVPSLQGARLKALDPSEFAGVIVDECHHAISPSYMNIFEHLDLLSETNTRPLVGFTATPRRGDGAGLSEVFEAIAFEFTIRQGIEQRFLSPLAGLRISTGTDLSGVATRAGDFAVGELATAVDTDQRNQIVVKAYLEHAEGRRALAFAVGVDHAKRLAEAFDAAGVAASMVSGETPKDERRAILAAFAAGEYRVLANCAVLTEGFDDPAVDCILMCRPTQSSLLYTQCIGRGTRLAPGKDDCLVLDFTDNAARHSVCTVASLFGLPAKLNLAGRKALEVKEQLELFEQDHPWLNLGQLEDIADLEFAARKIEFFSQRAPTDIEQFTRLAWMALPDGGYRLALPGGERFEVAPSRLDRWEVWFHEASSAGVVITECPDLGQAIQRADFECRHRRGQTIGLLDTRASWRQQPASDKQLALLERFGVEAPEGISKGQAASMITMCFESGKRRAYRKRPMASARGGVR